jgi:hypothetical protein
MNRCTRQCAPQMQHGAQFVEVDSECRSAGFKPGTSRYRSEGSNAGNPGSHARLPEMKGGVCVSTVSIVCGRRVRADQIRATVVIANIIGRDRPGLVLTRIVIHRRGRC